MVTQKTVLLLPGKGQEGEKSDGDKPGCCGRTGQGAAPGSGDASRTLTKWGAPWWMKVQCTGRPREEGVQLVREGRVEVTAVGWDPVVCPAEERRGLELLYPSRAPVHCHPQGPASLPGDTPAQVFTVWTRK